MKKSELEKILQDIPGDPEVIISRSCKEDGFSPLADTDYPAMYIPTTPSYGLAYNVDINEDEDGAINEKAIDCIVLWPTN